MPKEGFLKVVAPERPDIDSSKRAALLRKGNELFNAGDTEKAEKIFITLGYSDGIIRAGDYHYNKGEIYEAFRLYRLAPAPDRVSSLIESMASVVRRWLEDD